MKCRDLTNGIAMVGHPYMVSNCKQCPFRGMDKVCSLYFYTGKEVLQTLDDDIPDECPITMFEFITVELDDALRLKKLLKMLNICPGCKHEIKRGETVARVDDIEWHSDCYHYGFHTKDD